MESFLIYVRKTLNEVRHEKQTGCSGRQGLYRGKNLFEFRVAPTNGEIKGVETRQEMECGPGPMALCYKENAGWIMEQLGPTSGHWERRAREAHNENPRKEKTLDVKKRVGPTLLEELEPYVPDHKRRKTREQSKPQKKNSDTDGDEAVAAE